MKEERLDLREKLNNMVIDRMIKKTVDNTIYYIYGAYIKEVKKKQYKNNICVLDKGYYYLRILPIGKNYVLTAVYNENKELVIYKFDITVKNYINDDNSYPSYTSVNLKIILDTKYNVIVENKDKFKKYVDSNMLQDKDVINMCKEAKTILELISKKDNILKEKLGRWEKYFFDLFNFKENILEDNSNQIRNKIVPGLKVAIVLKKDQPTGKLTIGIVKDMLTHSNFHHRGIKVRLEDGSVGRVQKIYKAK